MTRLFITAGGALALAAGIWMLAGVTPALAYHDGHDDDDNNRITILDNCDPKDPGWAPTGGCLIKKGDVSFAEFGAFLFSPLGPGGILIGHPSWRNSPSYLSVDSDDKIRVVNKGGRVHTFTEVAQFGGGRVPPLNGGLGPAGACVTAGVVDLATGDRQVYKNLAPGVHRFQCCIHPWMRAVVRISDKKW
jgi:plastocyanin